MIDFFVFFGPSIALLLGLQVVSLSPCTCVQDAEVVRRHSYLLRVYEQRVIKKKGFFFVFFRR